MTSTQTRRWSDAASRADEGSPAAGRRPEDLCCADLEATARQDVVDAQVAEPAARRVVAEVRGVGGRIALVGLVRAALRSDRFDAARARWSARGIDDLRVEKLADGMRHAVAVEGVGILVAHDHEPLARAEPPARPSSSTR
jgi:hypothetical protein